MPYRNFSPNAAARKAQYTLTIAGTWLAGETVTIPIGGNSIVVTIGSLVTTAQVATTIAQAWESSAFTDTTASVVPQGGGVSMAEFSAMTATASASVVTIVGDVAGVSHVISAVTETSVSGTATLANTVVATGPQFADNVLNWIEGSIPITGDDVVVNGPFKILYGFAAFAAVVPASLTIGERCTDATQIGLPFLNAAGVIEYRGTELTISPTIINVRGAAGLVKINCAAAVFTANIYASGATRETGFSPIQLRGTNIANVVNAFGGNVSVAARGETAVVVTARQTGAGRLTIGNNVTFTNLSGTMTIIAD